MNNSGENFTCEIGVEELRCVLGQRDEADRLINHLNEKIAIYEVMTELAMRSEGHKVNTRVDIGGMKDSVAERINFAIEKGLADHTNRPMPAISDPKDAKIEELERQLEVYKMSRR